jgi:hypothetical protein
MKYSIDGKLRFQEYLEAHKKAALLRRSILPTVVVLGGLFAVVYTLSISLAESDMLSLQLGFGIGLIVYGLVLSPLQFRYRVKRNWNRYPAAHKQQKVFFDSSGVTTIDDVGNPAVTKWSKFINLKETKSSFLLFLSPLLWIIVPKRLLGIERVEAFRVFVTSMLNDHTKVNSDDIKSCE